MQHNKLAIGIKLDLPRLESAFGQFENLVSKGIKGRDVSFHYAQRYEDLVSQVTKNTDRDTDVILMHETPFVGDIRGNSEHESVLKHYDQVNAGLRTQVANMAQLEFIPNGNGHFSEPENKSSLLENSSINNLPQQISGSDDSGSGQFLSFLSWFDEAVESKVTT